jgi:hypothetical protein
VDWAYVREGADMSGLSGLSIAMIALKGMAVLVVSFFVGGFGLWLLQYLTRRIHTYYSGIAPKIAAVFVVASIICGFLVVPTFRANPSWVRWVLVAIFCVGFVLGANQFLYEKRSGPTDGSSRWFG